MNENKKATVEHVRRFLIDAVHRDDQRYWGVNNAEWFESVADAWMDDENNSTWRFRLMEQFTTLHTSTIILDMASGCGTFVFGGLKRGLDMWGVEPELWKNRFCLQKAICYEYPESWGARFAHAFGERLPFPDNRFDIVSSYQTLEHVASVKQCCGEMLRVVKPGGFLFLHFPDYRSSFEGHYRLPWLPLFPKPVARQYLKLFGRPCSGLDTIHYITKPSVIRDIRRLSFPVEIVDFDRRAIRERAHRIAGRKHNDMYAYSCAWIAEKVLKRVWRLFRSEKMVTVVVRRVE
jgi:ubiquinone/menaquinone biosynthesis C-methylase UbiE